MQIQNFIRNDRFWLFSSLVGLATIYLGLVWKVTVNIDRLTTDLLFWGVILWLLWKKKNKLKYSSDLFSSFAGFLLLGLLLSKTISLFGFESVFLSFIPVLSLISWVLIASGFMGLNQYIKELFFALFLFFPVGAIGFFLNRHFYITVINAKISTYLLYYLGFHTVSQGNEVILFLPKLGEFKAIVNLSCTGVPMMLLMLKLSLLLTSCVTLSKQQKIVLPSLSLALGFLLGVVRVCLLTLFIPNSDRFDYWHGNQGSQIFSTLAIIIFTGFCYHSLQKQNIYIPSSDLAKESIDNNIHTFNR